MNPQSGTSAPLGHGRRHRNECFPRIFEGLTEVFAPGRPPGISKWTSAGYPTPKTYSLGCFFVLEDPGRPRPKSREMPGHSLLKRQTAGHPRGRVWDIPPSWSLMSQEPGLANFCRLLGNFSQSLSEEIQKPQPLLALEKVLQYTSKFVRHYAPHLCIAIPGTNQYTSHLYCSTPPICTSVRLRKYWGLGSPESTPKFFTKLRLENAHLSNALAEMNTPIPEPPLMV